MNTDQKAAEGPTNTVGRVEDTPGYPSERGQRNLVGGNEAPGENGRADDTAEDVLAHEQAEKARAREKRTRENRAREEAAWEQFMREELREVELRRDGQLARLLGAPLPGEPAEALRRLCSEDQRQAEEGLVALMSKGKISYKRVSELCREDLPARLAANRARMTWLKERRDGWLV